MKKVQIDMRASGRDPKGFTLVELMIAIGLMAVVMAGVFTAYRTQAGLYHAQEDAVDMMQNARTAMFFMQRTIRMSGFDPLGTAAAGFVANFAPPYHSLGATTNSTGIAFTVDEDEDGTIDPDSTEVVAFRLDAAHQLQRLEIQPGTPGAGWQTLAENIDTLNFVYLDDAIPPNVLTPPFSAAQLATIRSVQVALVARTREKPSPLAPVKTDNQVYLNQQGTVILNPAGDRATRTVLSAQILCRNFTR